LHKRSIFLALFALLAAAVIVAGCGGGGSSSDTTATTGGSTEAEEAEGGGSTEEGEEGSGGAAPTKAAFIKEADMICHDDEAELNKELETFTKENKIEGEASEAQQEELFQTMVLPNIAKQGEEIAALTPPEGDEKAIEELTDALASEVKEAEEEGGLPGEDTLAGATKKAKAYGFKECGS
jgi:phosphotransferase system HPr-like phosphotransfer protein